LNGWQKSVLFLLTLIALLVVLALGATTFWLTRQTRVSLAPDNSGLAQHPPALPTTAPSNTPVSMPQATPTLRQTAPPTATGTRVVVQTVLPSPTATVSNCVSDVTNFETSGVLTDEQVRQYLRQTIPLNHLDNCRGITYVHTLAKIHGTEISGSTVPVYRKINVFQVAAPFQTTQYLLDTLTHEIGHNVQMNIRRTEPQWDKEWNTMYKQSLQTFAATGQGFVSDYARTNASEDFAETYMTYVRYPQILMAANPAKYEFMRQFVFGGQEFQP
jgi:hypothetical protein